MEYPSPYVRDLAEAVGSVVENWLTRLVVDTSRRITGTSTPALVEAARAMAAVSAPMVCERMDRLLLTDVDAQRTNPLSILRQAVLYPTEVLVAHQIPVPRRDDFVANAFPEDVYGLSPATWADVDESLIEPGLVWGAWKAKTVLDRRRC